MTIICPVCGKSLIRINNSHASSHQITVAEFHILRLEAEHGRPIKEFLQDIYVKQKLGTPEITRRYKITYRMLRRILEMNDIPLREMSDAIQASWERDDGTRKKMTSKMFKEINNNLDLSGDNNPAKRPEVRKKISLAKLRRNPGFIPMREALKNVRISRPTSIEIRMREALDRAEIAYECEYGIGRYFLDIALVPIKVNIECDGVYWHDPEHDARRDKFMIDRGWKVFRFTGKEIRDSADRCVQHVITQLQILGIDPPSAS